jgi:signal transduction histidine kinase/CheY-like chemotaxis protein
MQHDQQKPPHAPAAEVFDRSLLAAAIGGGITLLAVLLAIAVYHGLSPVLCAAMVIPTSLYVSWNAITVQRFRIAVHGQIREIEQARHEADAAAASKALFLANMSHEIRTPMNGILGVAELLLDTPLAGEQKSMANTIHDSAEALLTVLNDILDLSKIEAGKQELEQLPFSLARCIQDCATLLHGNAEQKGLELMTFIDPRLGPIHLGDAARIRQVVLNLLGNATKFTLKGEIVVGVDVLAEDERAQVVSISIRDTGIGISQEAIRRLFMPFAQADASTTRRFGGTGLGLAISARLVELMGGRIEVNSTVGFGSTFMFELLLPKVAAETDDDGPALDLSSHAILLVDSNETNLQLLTLQLMPTMVGIDIADTATAAVASLRRAAVTGHPFTLALLDAEALGSEARILLDALQQDASLPPPAIALIGGPDSHPLLPPESATVRWLRRPLTNSALLAALGELTAGPRPMAAPIEPAAAPTTTPAAIVAADPVKERIRVLIADDNEINRTVIGGMLHRLGCQVVFAVDGREALQLVQTQDFRLVLMDCQMPELDGFGAARAIRELGDAYRELPIVALTANVLPADRQACFDAGMNDFLAKPVRLPVLRQAVQRWTAPAAAATDGVPGSGS